MQTLTALEKEAARRYAVMQKSGLGLDWQEVRAWALTRAAGKPVHPPSVRSIRDSKSADAANDESC